MSPEDTRDTDGGVEGSGEHDQSDLTDPHIVEKASAAARSIQDSKDSGANPSPKRKPPPSTAALNEQEVKLGLPDCTWLGQFSFKRNLRTRIAKAINNISKKKQQKTPKYACEIEGHTGLEIVAILADEEYSTPPHQRIKSFKYKAEKKPGYKARHFIRDAIKTWRKDLKTMELKEKYGCNYGASKTHYFVVCYFDVEQD
ncbi:hypothetical protein Aduo_014471 [Ancylostoma duodenale]